LKINTQVSCNQGGSSTVLQYKQSCFLPVVVKILSLVISKLTRAKDYEYINIVEIISM